MLSTVDDVDIAGHRAPCLSSMCGSKGMDEVIVSTNAPAKYSLYLPNGEGVKISAMIRDAVEEDRVK